MGFYQTILQQYGAEVVRLLKQWATLNNKLASLRNRKIFLLACRSQGLIPTHIKNNTKALPNLIETTNGRIGQETLDFLLRLDKKILNFEINVTYKNVERTERSLKEITVKLKSKIPHNIVDQFFNYQNNTYERKFKTIKKTNQNKLTNLKKHENKEFLNTKDSWIKDLSECDIPTEIKQFLSLGQKFSIKPTPRDINLKDLLASIENVLGMYPEGGKNVLRAKVTNVLTNFFQKPVNNSYLRTLLFKTKAFFKEHPELMVTKADKGNVTVIIKKDDYYNKSLEILSDTTYYTMLNRDPTSTYQQKANKIVSKLKTSKLITDDQARQLTIYNQTSPKFYGLPKIHKPDIPLRPIISSINAPNSKLAQLATDILTQSYNNNNSYFTNDSFTFSNFINGTQLPQNYVIVSLDVVSLFSNIPCDLINASIKKHWPQISDNTSLPQGKFLEIVDFIFQTTYFQFNNNYYKQILGTPMGATISPIASQYVMDDLLDTCIPKLSFQLPFLKKYVDDIITAVPNNKVDEILTVFNSYNPNIQFTIETETDNSVPFLDTKLIRTESNLIKVDWYTKPTYSGRYINFHSYHTQKMKINLILALGNRIRKICHPDFLYKNLKKLHNILKDNSYPDWFIKKFLYNSKNTETRNNINSENLDITPDISAFLSINNDNISPEISAFLEENQQKYYFSLPYCQEFTHKIEKILTKQQGIKICGKQILKVSDTFSRLKDKEKPIKRSNVVYCLKCIDCDRNYIGQTSTVLQDRITRHRSDCRLQKNTCALSEHVKNTNHNIDFLNVKVIKSETHYNKRLFLEMVEIFLDSDCLNKKKDLDGLSIIYSNLLQSIQSKNNESSL